MKKFIGLTVLLLVLCIAGFWSTQTLLPSMLKNKLAESLSSLNIQSDQITIGKTEIKPGQVIFRDISMDEHNFNTARRIEAPVNLISSLINNKTIFSSIIIDELSLIKNWDELEPNKTFFSWITKGVPAPKIENTILNGGIVDLVTPHGGIRLHATGSMTHNEKSSTTKLRGRLWGNQNQITLDTLWNGEFSEDGSHLIEIEIRDGALNLDHINTGRMSGWVALEKNNSSFPVINGQIDAGQVTIGNLPLIKTTLTMNGPLGGYNLIFKGNIIFENSLTPIPFTIDLYNTPKTTTMNTTILANSKKDIVKLLEVLKPSLSQKPFNNDILAPLLLTEGNIKRIEAELQKSNAKKYTMKIKGPLYALTGSISSDDIYLTIQP